MKNAKSGKNGLRGNNKMFSKKGKIVKCPFCGGKNVTVQKPYAHAVEYHCQNIKCRKTFSKEYK